MSTKTHIIETSEYLFNKYGYASVGVDQIRDVANVSKTSIYRAFGSKNGLIKEILQQRHTDFTQSLLAFIRVNKEEMGAVNALLEWHIQWFHSKDFNGCMFMHALSEFKYTDNDIIKIAKEHKEDIKKIILSTMPETIANRQVEADKLFYLLEGMIISAEFGNNPERSVYIDNMHL